MACQFVYRFELTIVAQTELDATSLTKIKDLNNIKIMVVDDEPSLTSLLQDFLSSYGVYVVMFNSPKQAFEAFILQVEDIDLVITDQNMLRMSGMLSAEKMLRLKPLYLLFCALVLTNMLLQNLQRKWVLPDFSISS